MIKTDSKTKIGLNRDLNPGPLAPKARIIPLDHWALKIIIGKSLFKEMFRSNWKFYQSRSKVTFKTLILRSTLGTWSRFGFGRLFISNSTSVSYDLKTGPLNAVEVTVMLVTSRCWWLKVGDNFRMLMTDSRSWWHLLKVCARCLCKMIVDVGDRNGQNRHQYLIVITNTFPLQHPSPTSMWPSVESLSESYSII